MELEGFCGLEVCGVGAPTGQLGVGSGGCVVLALVINTRLEAACVWS